MGTNVATGAVKLFAQAGEETSGTGYATAATTQKVLSNVESFVAAEELVNAVSNQISATVFVGKDSEGNVKPLTFGVEVSEANSYDWTCMDNFSLTYLGALRNKVVLDEDNTDINNMNSQNNEVAKSGQSTIFLHRTLNAGKWNSIVLPFSISADVIKLVFGDNTKISKLATATDTDHPNWINFSDCTSAGIEAGKLYVINPERVAFNSTGGDVTSSADDKISIGQGKYYALDGSFGQSEYFTESITGEEFTYGTSEKVKFVGTYVKKENVIPVNSYYLSGDKWKYNTAKTSHAKAFRGWLQTESTAQPVAAFVVAINGVIAMDESVTGIDTATTADGKVYTVHDMSGRIVLRGAGSLDGLKPGCYIVNGHKMVVK